MAPTRVVVTAPARARPAPAWGALLVGAVWLLGQAFLLAAVGPRRGGDSQRYLDAAAAWLGGTWPSGGERLFSTYNLYVALCLGTGLGTVAVVLGQIALSGAAAWWLYRLGATLYEPRVGVLAALLYVADLDLQVWNLYVLTESLFVSLTVLALLVLVRADRPGAWLAAGVATVVAAGVRPHGIALLGAAAVFALSALWRARRTAALLVTGLAVLAAAVAAWVVIGGMLTGWVRPGRFLERGEVIWGDPASAVPLTAPPMASTGDPLRDLLAVIWAHPGHALHLAALRVGYEWAHVRPFYSTAHNVAVLVTLLPLYALAAWGLRRRAGRAGARGLLLALCALQSLIVALTFADWDGRHLLVLLPAVFVLAAAGASDLFDRWRTRGAGPAA